jgi:hypothetical protein
MPYDVTIDAAARRVHVRAFGPSSYDEAKDSIDRLVVDPAFEPTFSLLFDGREMEYLASYEDALRFRDLFQRMKDKFRGPMAIVVQGTARYGVSRMIASLLDLVGVKMEAFLSLPEAETWLDSHEAS